MKPLYESIYYEVEGYYVSNEGSKLKPNFHVWIPSCTHAICDSAYGNLDLAIARCKYLYKNKIVFYGNHWSIRTIL